MASTRRCDVNHVSVVHDACCNDDQVADVLTTCSVFRRRSLASGAVTAAAGHAGVRTRRHRRPTPASSSTSCKYMYIDYSSSARCAALVAAAAMRGK